PRRATERLCRAAGLPVRGAVPVGHPALPRGGAATDHRRDRTHVRMLARAGGLRDRIDGCEGHGMTAVHPIAPSPRQPMLQVDDLHVFFPVRRGPLFHRETLTLKAVDGVSFEVKEGQTFGIVGESGCGKTTTARTILKVETPTIGRVLWQGRNLAELDEQATRDYRSAVQAVFQDPFSSMNPPVPVGNFLTEPLVLNWRLRRGERRERARSGLRRVGLGPEGVHNSPHESRGGQRQRVGIARAIARARRLIVLDEPVSSLDVSIRAQVMNLLKSLQE